MDTKKMNQPDIETWGVAGAKVAPPVSVGIAQLLGADLSTWLLALTVLYTVLLLVHKLWRMALEGWAFCVCKKRPWNTPPADRE